MTERRANERRNWKGEVFPYDLTFPDDTRECQYCLTEKQAEILRGIIEPLGWSTRWWSDTQDIDQDTIEAFRDDIIRRLMMSCCGGEFEIIFRWTVDGVLQKSEDGGETWEDSPQDDPRNSSTTFPPVPGEPSDDKKCLAANSIKELIKEQVGDQLTEDMGRYTLGQLLNDWVTTVIQTSNPFRALITIIVNQILALSIALLIPALTDEVYEKLACCAIDTMEDDLSFTDDGWENFRECITSDISGIAGVFLEHLIFILGKIGCTNLARSQASVDDTCGCEGCASLFTVSFGTELSRTDSSITVQAAFNAPDGVYHAQITSGDQDLCCNANWATPVLEGNRLYYPCGLSSGSAVVNGVVPPVTPVWLIDETSGSPFTITYDLT